jgi:hypothetical protein
MPDPKPLPESIEKAIRRTIDVHANVNVAALRLAIAHELALRDAVAREVRDDFVNSHHQAIEPGLCRVCNALAALDRETRDR